MLLALCTALLQCSQLPLRSDHTLSSHLTSSNTTIFSSGACLAVYALHVCSNVTSMSCTTNTRSWAGERQLQSAISVSVCKGKRIQMCRLRKEESTWCQWKSAPSLQSVPHAQGIHVWESQYWSVSKVPREEECLLPCSQGMCATEVWPAQDSGSAKYQSYGRVWISSVKQCWSFWVTC